jgi:uncharacterized Tic20 family protein
MSTANVAVPAEERVTAVLAHLSGRGGYLIPFAGVIFPIVIWIVKSESPIISSIAKQALLLNLVAFLLTGVGFLLFTTILLIPVAILLWCVLAVAALLLPVVGAVKASEGTYYKYPLVGVAPR